MIEASTTSPPAPSATGVRPPGRVFDGTVNEPVLHQAVKVYLNNQRQGTAKTKTRSFVSGGNQKPWKQKGTGRARQGSTRAPHWRGGGTVFGPIPRDYRTDIPRKVKQLARKSALNARAREGAVHVVERFAFRGPRPPNSPGCSRAWASRSKGPGASAGDQRGPLPQRPQHPDRGRACRTPGLGVRHPWSEAVVVEEGALTGVMPEPLPDEPEARRPRPERRP